ncbi:unnamed protein product [Amoebophrya sp. A120]|nr:unnamed protein product [Amoebophrya sp. A120]|eukprot:GSA120T00000133001.1
MNFYYHQDIHLGSRTWAVGMVRCMCFPNSKKVVSLLHEMRELKGERLSVVSCILSLFVARESQDGMGSTSVADLSNSNSSSSPNELERGSSASAIQCREERVIFSWNLLDFFLLH